MESLSTEAQARLAAFRRAESPDRDIAARCLAALEQRLVEPDHIADAAPSRRRVLAPVVAGLALAAGLLLALTWAATGGIMPPQAGSAAAYHNHDEPARHLALPRAPEPSPRAHTKVVPAAPSQPEPEEPAEGPPALELVGPEEPVPSDTSKPTPRRPARAEDAIAAEVDLLRRAKLAGPGARLVLLEEHARRFPAGILAAERELLVIETRCALNEVERARHLAERFMRRFPGSPLAERVATICGGPESAP